MARWAVGTIASTLGLAVLFLLVTGVIGIFGVPEAARRGAPPKATSPATVTVVALVVTIAFAELADAAKLAFIIGAFMAGLGLGRSRQHDRIARDLGAVGNILIPGVLRPDRHQHRPRGHVQAVRARVWPRSCRVVAIAGKLVSALGTFGTRVDRLLVGLGMIPRGEVGLIFASIGLGNGVLDADQYGGLVLVVLVTTVITPPLLRWRLGRADAGGRRDRGRRRTHRADGSARDSGEILLNAIPPVALTVPVALTHRLAGIDGAGPPASCSIGSATTARPLLTWDRTDTATLVRLLRDGNPRAWRFLDVAGVIERALPEVAAFDEPTPRRHRRPRPCGRAAVPRRRTPRRAGTRTGASRATIW